MKYRRLSFTLLCRTCESRTSREYSWRVSGSKNNSLFSSTGRQKTLKLIRSNQAEMNVSVYSMRVLAVLPTLLKA